MWTVNFQMFKLGLEKAEELEIKLPTSAGPYRMQVNSKKTIYFCFIVFVKGWKLFIVCIPTNYGKFLKRWDYQTTWSVSWEICMQVKKQQLELGMEKQNGSKWGKVYLKAVYCHPAYLTYMQSTSWERPGWMKHKLQSSFPGAISITSDMQMIPSLWQKWRGTKKPLDKSERGEWKSWLKTQHSES